VTQVGGLDLLLAWGMFVLLVAVLVWFLLRPDTDPIDEAARSTSDETPPSPRGD